MRLRCEFGRSVGSALASKEFLDVWNTVLAEEHPRADEQGRCSEEAALGGLFRGGFQRILDGWFLGRGDDLLAGEAVLIKCLGDLARIVEVPGIGPHRLEDRV